jgi:hypothetical protein
VIHNESHEQRILEYLRYVSAQAFSAEFLENVSFNSYRRRLDEMIVMIQARVLSDQLLKDRGVVPFSGYVRERDLPTSVMVEIPSWWRRLLHRPLRKRWLTVVGKAAYGKLPASIPVSGTASVHARYFATFPHAPRYTSNFGPMVALIQTDEPDPTYWEPDL